MLVPMILEGPGNGFPKGTQESRLLKNANLVK